VPSWPLFVGALALVLVAVIGGYTGGLLVADTGGAQEPEMTVTSGILVQPPGAPEESEEPEEEEEYVHPAGLDPALVYVLQNVHGDRVADVAGASTDNGAPVHLWDRHDADNQRWRFVPLDEDGFYEIEGVGSGKVLEVSGDPARPGATLLTRTGADHQHWSLVEAEGGAVRLLNRATGQALEGQGGSPDNGTALVQAPDGSHAHQQWRLLPVG